MKTLQKIFKKNVVFVIFFAVLGLILFVTISVTLVMPRFLSFLSIRLENDLTKQRIVELDKNIKDTAAIDAVEASKFFSLVDSLIPEKEDVLRFVTLTENIAKSSGVALDTFDTSPTKVVPGSTQPAPAQPPVEGGGEGQQPAGSGQPLTGVPSSGNTFKVGVTISGSFVNIIKFISNYLKSDRLLGINDVAFSTSEDGVSVVLGVELPLSPSTTTVVIGDDLTLTEAEREQLKQIEDSKFTVSPATNPLGPSDPFR